MSLKHMCYAMVDGFTDLTGSDIKRREMYMDVVATILAFIISIIILGFVGKWLWNNVITEMFTFAKPIRSVWYVIGLMIFLSLLK